MTPASAAVRITMTIHRATFPPPITRSIIPPGPSPSIIRPSLFSWAKLRGPSGSPSR